MYLELGPMEQASAELAEQFQQLDVLTGQLLDAKLGLEKAQSNSDMLALAAYETELLEDSEELRSLAQEQHEVLNHEAYRLFGDAYDKLSAAQQAHVQDQCFQSSNESERDDAAKALEDQLAAEVQDIDPTVSDVEIGIGELTFTDFNTAVTYSVMTDYHEDMLGIATPVKVLKFDYSRLREDNGIGLDTYVSNKDDEGMEMEMVGGEEAITVTKRAGTILNIIRAQAKKRLEA